MQNVINFKGIKFIPFFSQVVSSQLIEFDLAAWNLSAKMSLNQAHKINFSNQLLKHSIQVIQHNAVNFKRAASSVTFVKFSYKHKTYYSINISSCEIL